MNKEIILTGGRIYTQWAARQWVSALAIAGGRVVAAGNDDEIEALAGPDSERIALGGRLVLPGLTDAHIHFYDWALASRTVDLVGTPDLDNLVARMTSAAAEVEEGAWITGRGWNETEWARPVMPTADDLDRVSTRHPILVWRSDLHGAVANHAALEAAGLDPTSPDPPGGHIERDESGRLTGRLFELAINAVRSRMPAPGPAEIEEALAGAIERCYPLGLTGIHDQRMKAHGEGAKALRTFSRLDRAGRLGLRVTCNVDAQERAAVFRTGVMSGFGSARLQIGHIKVFVDGSLGSQTAWMLEPFEGSEDNTGIVLTPTDELEAVVRESQKHGFAVSVHAIGDRANREMLDIFEELAGERDPTVSMPHRIEHVQTIQPEDLPRLARLGIVASVQPLHLADDLIAVDRLWGERGRNTYPFRSLLDSGAVLAFGSDWPVADPNPFYGIHAAVTRRRQDGRPAGGWYPDQRLTLEEAIAGYTTGAAWAVGRPSELGRLAPGYLADLIVLDRDLFQIDPDEIPGTQVEMVLFDGAVVYRR